MDVALLVFLILLNGVFAMSRWRSPRAARRGCRSWSRPGAGCPGGDGTAREPDALLSTVQVGITSIGVLNGIVGEGVLAEPLARAGCRALPLTPKVARVSATALVVAIITS